MRALEEAIRPLLAVLDPPLRRDCPIALVIIRSRAINAGAGTTPDGAARVCTAFTLAVTEGALQRLSPDMLRAMVAHELGHVRLGHLEERRERRPTPALLRPFTAEFDRRQEAAADRFAVEMLRRLEPSRPGACVALVYVLALLAEQPRGTGWLAAHPSPDGRAETALAGCNAG